jgi:hypothetical protein
LPPCSFQLLKFRELPIETPPCEGFDTRIKFWTESFLPGKPTPRQLSARLIAGHTLSSMVDRTYLVTLRPPSRAIQQGVRSKS